MHFHKPKHPVIITLTTVVTAGVLAVAGYGMSHAPAQRPTKTNREVSRRYAQICYDTYTNTRLPDEACEDDTSSHSNGGRAHWYWISGARSNKRVPGIGQPVGEGSTRRPQQAQISTGISTHGGSFAESFRTARNQSDTQGNSSDSNGAGKSSDKTSTKKTGPRGGFGSGARTGGGSSGG